MKKRLILNRLFLLMTAIGTVGFTNYASAAAFQLWEQDGASVGNYHAGRAAIAADASTAFYNPAGLVRIPNQELVVGLVPITVDFLFDGTVAVGDMRMPGEPVSAKAQGGTFNLAPDLHYAAPITNNLVFGLSAVVPFGLKTDYGKDTYVRYAGTLTSLEMFDLSPSLGFAINDKLSFGFGLDINRARLRVDMVATLFGPITDTDSENSVTSNTAFGYHLGLLYQFSPQTRIGLAYQSKTILHFRDGESKFEGPLANLSADEPGGIQESDEFETDMTLPATTTLSIFHTINKQWDVMATVSYTQWNVFDEAVLDNVAGIDFTEEEGEFESNDITVVIPQGYRNTWNYSVGANYHVNEQWFLRAGLGYDQTPSNNDDRNIQLPDADRYAAALGVHYQPLKTLGFDLGWTHFFTGEVPIDVTQQVGAQVTTTDGNVHGNADVYGFQMTWDIV